MANKRILKKQVKYICGDLATECMLTADYVDGVDRTTMCAIVSKIARLQTTALSNVSFGFDKAASDYATKAEYNKAKAAYFKKAFATFREKFNARIQEIVKEMNAALPQVVKDANKGAK